MDQALMFLALFHAVFGDSICIGYSISMITLVMQLMQQQMLG